MDGTREAVSQPASQPSSPRHREGACNRRRVWSLTECVLVRVVAGPVSGDGLIYPYAPHPAAPLCSALPPRENSASPHPPNQPSTASTRRQRHLLCLRLLRELPFHLCYFVLLCPFSVVIAVYLCLLFFFIFHFIFYLYITLYFLFPLLSFFSFFLFVRIVFFFLSQLYHSFSSSSFLLPFLLRLLHLTASFHISILFISFFFILFLYFFCSCLSGFLCS